MKQFTYLSPVWPGFISRALLFSKMNFSRLSRPFWCGAFSTNCEKPNLRSKSRLAFVGGITVGFGNHIKIKLRNMFDLKYCS